MDNKKTVTAIVVGYGFRGEAYTEFAFQNPDKIKMVGVVEPNVARLKKAKEKFKIADDMCFDSFDKFVAKGKIADCVINATMDNLHVATALPLLSLGYDMLLEKPITSDPQELMKVAKTANEHNCKLIICHVLRYTPFYVKIKELIEDGTVGKLRHIETSENVGFPHASSSYVRGKWNNREKCGSSYLLAKCCHDLDLLCWLNHHTEPNSVASMGGKDFFVEKNAPVGAGTRCLLDCKIEKECPYSIRKFAVKYNPFENYIWENYQDKNFTPEERENNLKFENPHGRCIFKTDADIIDQQITTIKFKDGSTAEHTLMSGAPVASRRIHIYGDKAEIIGFLETSHIMLYTYNPKTLKFKKKRIRIDTSMVKKGHAGGDYLIMEDLYRTLTGQPRSISCTNIEDSINGHICVYCADKALEEQRYVFINELKK